MAQSDESLPPERRIAHYRAMAAEALQLAQSASDEAQKAAYIDIAARWKVLATEVKRQSGRAAEAVHIHKNKSNSESNGDHK